MDPSQQQRQLQRELARNWYVDDFLEYIAVERYLSDRTVTEYGDDLQIFLEFSKPNFEAGMTLADIDARTIREFLRYLREERQYTPKGLNRKIACLRSYFHFLEHEHYIPASPMNDIRSAKDGRMLPKVLNLEDMEQIFAAAERRIASDPGNWLYVRDLAIVEIFYATGMRLDELVKSNISDYDTENQRILVTGKGNKQRYVFLNDSSRLALERYFKCRPRTKNPAIFLNRFANRFSRRGVEIMLDKVLAEAGILHTASPHTLRHTFATHMLEGGSDLMTIKELLGHQSLSTTQIYTNISRQQMREVYDASHPRHAARVPRPALPEDSDDY